MWKNKFLSDGEKKMLSRAVVETQI
jgi:hypothetical protein